MTIAACAALVERGDPDRFLSVMAAPPDVRGRLFVLYAFNLEVARAPWVTGEPLIAEMRLQWWRDVVENTASGAARAHEVAGPLHDLMAGAGLPVALLDQLISARRWDVHRDPFEDAPAFKAHLQATAGNLMWLAALALGAPPGAEPVVRDFAFGAGLANWLVAMPELAARGRQPLVDTSPEAIAALARDGLAGIARARAARGRVPATTAPALLAGWQAATLLRQAALDPGQVAAGSIRQSEFARRWGLTWRGLTGIW
jgi:15-cis-phytoene synthase